ncbi:hypothetical protein L1049_003691 [Liquidambar formosana]|uniref:Uncharacterized protein n=1 Tax=Liquidambar formosana TaxID=63359 RepID=A0AAP0RQJ7_LIQFO
MMFLVTFILELMDETFTALETIQLDISSNGFTDDKFEAESAAKIALCEALKSQEELWKEKSRINWLEVRDRNTSFFHKAVQIRGSINYISSLIDGDRLLDTVADIQSHIISYFQQLFTSIPHVVDTEWISNQILSLVSTDDNAMFTAAS